MRGRKVFILLGIIGGAILSAFMVSRVFVYDTNVAHPGLTKLAGELYNQIAENNAGLNLPPLNAEEIGWLMQGAIEEDTPLRWMNHFYDPIYNKGYKGSFDTAKIWSQDVNGQTSYSQGDQTWQRAIYEYQKGNKQQAFIALGHVLHLLEDLTVPAHTRDDGHIEGDPYENWARDNFQPVSGSLIYFNSLSPYFDFLANYSNNNFYSKDTIESSRYSVISIRGFENHLSSNGRVRKYAFTESTGKIYLFWIDTDFEWINLSPEPNTDLKSIKDPLILSSHFSLLAPKAVGAGAGVIKLFFEEVQKQQAYQPPLFQINPLGIIQQGGAETVVNLASIYQNISQQGGNLWGAVSNLLWNFGDNTARWNFVTELFATQTVLADELKNAFSTSQILVSQVPARIIVETGQAIVSSFEPNPSPAPVAAPVVLTTTPAPSRPDVGTSSSKGGDKPPINPSSSKTDQTNQTGSSLLDGFLASPSAPASAERSLGGPTTPSPTKVGATPSLPANPQPIISGGSVSWSQAAPTISPPAGGSPSRPDVGTGSSEGGDNTPPSPPPDTTPPDAPLILEPATTPFWTKQTTTTLSGQVSTDTFKLLFNDSEAVVSSSVWSREVELSEGENIFNLRAADLAGNLSATSSVKIIKDTTAPTSTIQSAKNKEQGTKIDLVWSGDDKNGIGVASYDLEYQKSEIGSASSSEWLAWQTAVTSSQAIFSGETGYQYQFRVRATDQLGNLGDWAVSASQAIEMPRVVINEIAWGGTVAAANDEWMELYNAGDYPVDLSNWILTDGGDINIVFSTSDSVAAKGFYLLERTSDETIKDITANKIYTGALRDSGENLTLKDSRGRVIDEVKAGAQWFAGYNVSNRATMERQDPTVSGNLAGNWQSTPANPRQGRDAQSNPITGTPKRPNSPFIYLNGTLTANRTITLENNPYFLGTYTVASGTVLTIGPGVIVKAGVGGTSWGTGNLFVYGTVVSQGTTEAPVVFTSYRDSAYAGNTNTWDSATTAGPGEWERLTFYPGSRADLSNTKILYGNYRSRDNDPNGSLIVSGAMASLSNVTVGYARAVNNDIAVSLTNASTTIMASSLVENGTGFLIDNGIAVVSQSIFENNATGLDVKNNANLTLKENNFQSNGLKSGGLGPARIRDSVLKAENNQFQNNSLNGLDWGGNLNGEQIIDNAGSWPWISSGFTVPAGSVLTVKAGSYLKMKTSALILIKGALQVEGTENQPVVFTTYHDDSDGFDSDGLTQAPNPTGGEWYQLRFDSAATSTLNYLTVHYANQRTWSSDPVGSVYLNQTPLTANHLEIKYSRLPDAALHLKNANQVMITNSLFKNDYKAPLNPYGSNGAGILIDAGAPMMANSTIDTFNYGVLRQNSPREQLIDINYVNVDKTVVGN